MKEFKKGVTYVGKTTRVEVLCMEDSNLCFSLFTGLIVKEKGIYKLGERMELSKEQFTKKEEPVVEPKQPKFKKGGTYISIDKDVEIIYTGKGDSHSAFSGYCIKHNIKEYKNTYAGNWGKRFFKEKL